MPLGGDGEKRNYMTKAIHSGRPKASALGKARAGRSAHVMNPEYLAEIERFRLMDDTFMSKCLENARANDGAEPKRARYNAALMDANALKSGEDVDKLRDTYVIFITENDVMKDGRDLYSYQRIDDKTGKKLGDGTHIIYVNGATRSESDIGKLMHDFLCRNAEEMYFDILKRQVSQFKNSEEGRLYMCEAMERIAERREARGVARGKREGKLEGKRETMLATAKRMLKSGMLALKDIAKFSGLSLAQVKELQASMA